MCSSRQNVFNPRHPRPSCREMADIINEWTKCKKHRKVQLIKIVLVLVYMYMYMYIQNIVKLLVLTCRVLLHTFTVCLLRNPFKLYMYMYV